MIKASDIYAKLSSKRLDEANLSKVDDNKKIVVAFLTKLENSSKVLTDESLKAAEFLADLGKVSEDYAQKLQAFQKAQDEFIAIIESLVKARINEAQDNYKDIEVKLSNLTPFKGNSASATMEGNNYVVKSYNTIIAKYNVDKKELEYFDEKKYSSTTSRLQNMIRKILK